MKAQFNPTGTHDKDGFLKVRFDLYPDVGDKTYALHDVEVPVIPPEGYQGEVDGMGSPVDQNDYDNWIDGLPKIRQLNPALCHFIRIKETSTKADLTDYLEQIFNPTVIKTLDDILILPNSSHLISPLMRNKAALTTEKIVTKDIEDLILSVNSRFASLVLAKAASDKGLDIVSQSIDVGSTSFDGTTNFGISTWTVVEQFNPANADGTITGGAIWLASTSGVIDVWVGLFSAVGNTLTCEDSESVGDIAAGSEQTLSGLDINCETGWYIGTHCKSGAPAIERNSSGAVGIWYKSGEFIDPTDSATFGVLSGDEISLYGTGIEGGPAGWTGIAKVNSVGEGAIGTVKGTAKADIGTVIGVAV